MANISEVKTQPTKMNKGLKIALIVVFSVIVFWQ